MTERSPAPRAGLFAFLRGTAPLTAGCSSRAMRFARDRMRYGRPVAERFAPAGVGDEAAALRICLPATSIAGRERLGLELIALRVHTAVSLLQVTVFPKPLDADLGRRLVETRPSVWTAR